MTANRFTVISSLQPDSFVRHALHADTCAWPEKNCYVDLWIEVLHALKLEPLAMLGSTLAIDFEGDQWTFFKPSHEDLRELYGVDIQEMTVWRPLLEHAIEHLGTGKLLATESDAYWLPDTAGTDYRRQHTKTTIVLNDLDLPSKRLGYFHNAGYYTLEGEDFEQTFRVGSPPDSTILPLFAELVRIDRLVSADDDTLRQKATLLLQRSLSRAAATNPVERFAARFAQYLPLLQQAGLSTYHSWAFANTRQLGAGCEAIAAHLRWLAPEDPVCFNAAADFEAVSANAKAFILKGARAVNAKRSLESAPMFDDMATRWDRAMAQLRNR